MKADLLARLRDIQHNDFHNADTLKQVIAEIEWLRKACIIGEICDICHSSPCGFDCGKEVEGGH